ncbi:NADP-dependent oxidoreductase [Arsenicibacter rosenii]|uniref:NADPH quinone reductase n=1 Tax=Arsenicibacter rosenii TaxID=1750698 RepID=A0A1S2VHQ5_9BACT|nr:NADP-dependent oxidoreductase [Arsenicibacter rosenii]OIN58281.1 NADPH quinone reductase [Arsenicibacter rosenii]
MKAIQYNDFGSSDVLVLNEIPQPELKTADDVLIQVKAASVNPLDIKIRMGYMQQMRPVQLPFVPGLDAAGIVVAVGDNVKNFTVGDEVMAVTMANAYAEFVVANQNFVSHKPSNITFEEATSLAVNIGTAESILFTEGKLEEGQKVLIQGAAGSVGATMVQLAKNKGLYVYATASGRGVDIVKELGADEVFDYKTTDISKQGIAVDLVADCAGGPSQASLFDVLKQGGKLLSIAAMPSPELARQYQVDARFVSSNLTSKSLENGLQLVKEGKIKAFVSKIVPLAEAAQAQDFVSAGGVNGKVVLAVS